MLANVPPYQLALQLLAGVAVLLFGRRLFWLFVAVVGFVATLEAVPLLLPGEPDWRVLLVALVVGAIGAIVAIFLQYVAAGVIGFLVGGRAMLSLGLYIGIASGPWLGIAGGVLGTVLAVMLFDWAIIGLSALAGATLVLEVFTLPPLGYGLALAGLWVLGVAVQATVLSRGAAPPNR